MKLALRLVSAIVLGIVILIAVDGYFYVRHEVAYFRDQTEQELIALGRTLADLVSKAWQSDGRDHALALVATANENSEPVRIEWVNAEGGPGMDATPEAGVHAAVAKGKPITLERRENGRPAIIQTYVPVVIDGGRMGALRLSEPLDVIANFNRRTMWRAFRLSAGVIALGTVLAFALGLWMIGRPLDRLIRKTRRIGSGDLSGPLHIRTGGELFELAGAMNAMCADLQQAQERAQAESEAKILALEQLRHADRLKTVGRLASGVAHELGTPLNVIAGRAALISSGELTKAELMKSAETVREQADRMTAIIRQLLDFSRARQANKEPHDLRGLVRQTIDLMHPLARKQEAELTFENGTDAFQANVDPGQIQQVLTNLIMNAIQAVSPGGVVRVGLGSRHAEPPAGHPSKAGTYGVITVSDNGKGIAEDDIRHVFEPFYTTKDIGEGSGLGLSIAHGLVHEHGGWIEVDSKVNEGTTFTMYLPVKE